MDDCSISGRSETTSIVTLSVKGLEPAQPDLDIEAAACRKWAYNCILGGK